MATAAAAMTPLQVDEKAREFERLKEAVDRSMKAAKEAQVPLDELKEELIEMVREFGSAHAEKSKIVHGIASEVMVSFGQSVSIDAAAVEKFRAALADSGAARLCKKIFEQSIRWSLMPDSAAIIKAQTLSKPLLALYSQCQVIRETGPRLTVRPAGGR